MLLFSPSQFLVRTWHPPADSAGPVMTASSFPIFRQELSLPCDVAHNALFWRSPEASCIGLFSCKGFAMPCTWVLRQAGQLSRKYLIT